MSGMCANDYVAPDPVNFLTASPSMVAATLLSEVQFQIATSDGAIRGNVIQNLPPGVTNLGTVTLNIGGADVVINNFIITNNGNSIQYNYQNNRAFGDALNNAVRCRDNTYGRFIMQVNGQWTDRPGDNYNELWRFTNGVPFGQQY